MVKSVLNKIVNNIWLFVCLTLGSLMMTAILSSIPTYTDGAQRKMLRTELDNFQADAGTSAGQFHVRVSFGGDYMSGQVLGFVDTFRERFDKSFDEAGVAYTESFESGVIRMLNERGDGMTYTSAYSMRYMTGLEEHVELLEGRMYADTLDEEGVYEVIVSQQAFNSNVIHLGQVYSFHLLTPVETAPVIRARVVGVFAPREGDSDYFYGAEDGYSTMFFCAQDAFQEGMMTQENAQFITAMEYYHHIDFYGMEQEDLNTFFSVYGSISDYLEENFPSGRRLVTFPLYRTLRDYRDKGWQLELTLWVFNAPIIIMLVFYLYMVSRMIIEEDKNEISSLKSRGAEPLQVFARYAIECGLIIAFSLLLGPPLGMALAQWIGSANGFLEFVNRSDLTLHLLPTSYFYALIAGVLFLVMVLIPAYRATKTTIVQHKQRKARKNQKPFWEKAFLDVIFLAISLFMLILYRQFDNLQDVLSKSGGSNAPVYFVYFISTMFILSAGLVFLRIYPYILKLIFALTRRKMPPTVYATFVQVSRTGNDNRFLILFLILTISVGIYSSSSARIINYNVEETAAYKNGADVVLSPDWSEALENATSQSAASEAVRLPLTDYLTMDCFANTTNVATVRNTSIKSVYAYEWEENIRLMGIDPYTFPQVVSFRSSLLDREAEEPVHWFRYMNLMQEYPTAILLSRGVADECKLRVGDTVEIDLNTPGTPEDRLLPTMNCYVLGIFDFWPNYYEGAVNTDNVNELIVMNYSYLTSVKNDTTYDLWCKLKDGATSDDVDRILREKDLYGGLTAVRYESDFLRRGKNESMTIALNGSLSLSFVATVLISFIGFLLYWIMNMRRRRLQFGILRAMGLTRVQVSCMLGLEHLLTSGVAVGIGIVIGNMTTRLFTPILQQTYQTMLPLQITFSSSDTVRIVAIGAVMIAIGIAVLSVFIRKLKINEAVKIGED